MPEQTTTSTGHYLADVTHLDNHYRVARPEYEDTLRNVGIKSGWRVLDAGCGGGSFLPLMVELVGSQGKVVAIDLAPENINNAQAMIDESKFPCEVTAKVSSVTSLPFMDNEFDCVWCANVAQYLTKPEFTQALAEFIRVVKPGGTVAIKEVDISGWQFQPMETTLMWRWIAARRKSVPSTPTVGGLAGTRVATWLREAGLSDIQRKSWMVERWSPLDPLTRSYVIDNLKFLSSATAKRDLSVEDIAQWQAISDNPDLLVDHPDFCYRELYVLAKGKVEK